MTHSRLSYFSLKRISRTSHLAFTVHTLVFQTSDEYRTKLEDLRDNARQLIRKGRAAECQATWTVGGSAKEDARIAKQNMKLFLRAFNGECDAAVSNVSWTKVTKMEERKRKSFDAINQLGAVLKVAITNEIRRSEALRVEAHAGRRH